jgi:hypothetical protein
MFVSLVLIVSHKGFLMNYKDKKGFSMNEPSKYIRKFGMRPVFINCAICSGLHMTITREITARLHKKFHCSSGFLYYVTLKELLAVTVLYHNMYFYLATNLFLLYMGIIYIRCII